MTAGRVDPSALHCPACGGVVAGMHARCPHCRFTGQDSIGMFGNGFAVLEGLSDPEGILDEKAAKAIHKARHALRRRFPQIRVFIQMVTLPKEASPCVYGFWRLNTAPLGSRESEKHRTWSILLLVDQQAGLASVACGYRIGHLVRDDAWREALEKMRKPWNKDRLGDAVAAFLREAAVQIDRAWTDNVMRPD